MQVAQLRPSSRPLAWARPHRRALALRWCGAARAQGGGESGETGGGSKKKIGEGNSTWTDKAWGQGEGEVRDRASSRINLAATRARRMNDPLL